MEAKSLEAESIVIGDTFNKRDDENCIAVGMDVTTSGKGAISIGVGSGAHGDGAMAFGHRAYAEGKGAIAIGDGVRAIGDGVVVIADGHLFNADNVKELRAMLQGVFLVYGTLRTVTTGSEFSAAMNLLRRWKADPGSAPSNLLADTTTFIEHIEAGGIGEVSDQPDNRPGVSDCPSGCRTVTGQVNHDYCLRCRKKHDRS